MNAHEWVEATCAEAHSTVCCSVLQCDAVSCSVLQCDAVCCSVLWLCHSTLWQSHISNEWVMSHINELRDKWMGHVKAHHCNTHQPTATHRSTLQHTATQRKLNQRHKEKKWRGIMAQTRCAEACVVCGSLMTRSILPLCLLTDYNTLQHTTTRCNTLQHASTHTSCGKGYFERTATHCNPSPCAVLQKTNWQHQTKKSINDAGEDRQSGT